MRSEFLQKNWKSYPSMAECRSLAESLVGKGFAEVVGRIENLDAKTGGFKLGAKVRQMAECLHLGPLKQSQLTPNQNLQVLNTGDWVYLAESEKGFVLLLMSPRLHPNKAVPAIKKHQSDWSKFTHLVRSFFFAQNFIETPTPTLVKCPGTEVYLDLFSTEFVLGKTRTKYYLPTSPELNLKKKLAAGENRIFEIKNCFRNSEKSVHHSPEFTMLEWYRNFASLEDIMLDVRNLIQHVCQNFSIATPDFQQLSVAESFKKYLQFELTPSTTRQELVQLANDNGVRTESTDTWDEVYFRIFLEKIEPHFQIQPSQNGSLSENKTVLFLYDYPPSQAAYARIGKSGWAERFEVYWKGLELANAFHELNDPVIQKERFQQDLDEKRRIGKEVPELDEEFYLALEQGMPPSAGIALGMERLFMALHELSDIQDCH